MSVHLYRGSPRTGRKTTGSETCPGRQTGLPERPRSISNSAGVPRGGVAILPEGRADVRARRLHDWARLGHERREATSDASDSKGGDGGRVATCDGSVDRPGGWCTQRSQCCPNGPVYASRVAAFWSGAEQAILPATWGNWYATAAGALSRAPRLRARCTWPPSPWQRRLLKQQHAWILALGELLPEERQGLTMGWRCDGRTGWVRPGMCRGAMPISGLGREANAEAVSYEAIRAAW